MIRLISICCLTLLIACGNTREAPAGAATEDTAADEAAIRAGDSAWFTHYNAGHVDSVAALYADDAVLNIPGMPPARGPGSIREALAKDIAGASEGGFTLTQGPTPEIGVSGDLAYTWNTFKVTDKSGATVDVGKYVTVAARKTGEWRIVRDIWNSDNPPAPPQKPAS
jgi:uncharacterized protein (TIGR02246 family)